MAGYCSAVQDDKSAAGLAARTWHARKESRRLPASKLLMPCRSVPSPGIRRSNRYRCSTTGSLRRWGDLPHKAVLEKGEPALLVALATDHRRPSISALPATEAAARLNALTPEALAGIYRVNGEQVSPDDLLGGRGPQGVARRAALFRAAGEERTPMRKARLIRAFLDDAKHEGLGMIGAEMIGADRRAIAARRRKSAGSPKRVSKSGWRRASSTWLETGSRSPSRAAARVSVIGGHLSISPI